MSSFSILALIMAGWSSNNKWSTLGAMRSAAQMISYEIPLGLALVAVGMLAGTLSLEGIVEAQQERTWFLLLQPLGFLVFIVAATAEINRAPFNLPEAESELVAGFNTEYSGFRWGVFFVAEYANLLFMAGMAATLFLGGWSGPAFLPLPLVAAEDVPVRLPDHVGGVDPPPDPGGPAHGAGLEVPDPGGPGQHRADGGLCHPHLTGNRQLDPARRRVWIGV